MKSFDQKMFEKHIEPVKLVEFNLRIQSQGHLASRMAGVLRRANIKVTKKIGEGKMEWYVKPENFLTARTIISKIK